MELHNFSRSDEVGMANAVNITAAVNLRRRAVNYACEAYGRILERAKNPTERRQLHAEYAESWVPSTDRVDQDELVDILAEAVDARNGWKRILKSCAPPKRVPMSVWIKQAAREAVVRADRNEACEIEEE